MNNKFLRHMFYQDEKLIDNLYYQLNDIKKTIKTFENRKKSINADANIGMKIRKIFGVGMEIDSNFEKIDSIERVSEISLDPKIDFLISVANGKEEIPLFKTLERCNDNDFNLIVGNAIMFEKSREKDYFNMQIVCVELRDMEFFWLQPKDIENIEDTKIIMKASKSKCFDDFTESTLPPEYYRNILGIFYKFEDYYKIKPIAWYHLTKL